MWNYHTNIKRKFMLVGFINFYLSPFSVFPSFKRINQSSFDNKIHRHNPISPYFWNRNFLQIDGSIHSSLPIYVQLCDINKSSIWPTKEQIMQTSDYLKVGGRWDRYYLEKKLDQFWISFNLLTYPFPVSLALKDCNSYFLHMWYSSGSSWQRS